MLEPALLALSSSAVVLADARILALLALPSLTVVLADARSFRQCRLYRFDYIKFWFGHLYEDASFYTYMCPASATIYVSSYYGVLLVVQVWSSVRRCNFYVCAFS
jgi:hypothetical protein